MAGEPQHAAAEAPVARAARHDDGVESVLAHLRPQRRIAAVVFLPRELLIDRVPVIGRVAHIGEGKRLVELGADDLPRLRADAGRLDVHDLFLAIADGDGAAGFLAASMSPTSTLLSIVHWVRAALKPSLTPQTHFLVLTLQAYSTASCGFSVAFTMIGMTL